MITKRPSNERGHANHGWLDTYHTFSFASYFDRDHMGLGALRVINQDRVIGGKGFPTHGHENMEIVSYVLSGVLEHKDSVGTTSRIYPGDVQLMSAGTGVTHSEYNADPKEPVEFLQMWVLPSENGTEPRYEQKHFPASERKNAARLVASPDGRNGSLTIGQDVLLYAGVVETGERVRVELRPDHKAWVHVARGTLDLNDETLGPGDGAAIEFETALHFVGAGSVGEPDAEFVLFDLS
jgi:redox-sensitive bicupin YhaK (pirin superfamily)